MMIWKFDLSERIKLEFFQQVAMEEVILGNGNVAP